MENVPFTESMLRSHVGETYYLRGGRYFRKGAVLEFQQEALGQFVGKVKGSRPRPYTVDLDVIGGGNRLSSTCSCPMQSHCKHVAALGLKILEETKGLPESTLAPSEQTNDDDQDFERDPRPQPTSTSELFRQLRYLTPSERYERLYAYQKNRRAKLTQSTWKEKLNQWLDLSASPETPSKRKTELRLLFDLVKQPDYLSLHSTRNKAVYDLKIRLTVYDFDQKRLYLSEVRWKDIAQRNSWKFAGLRVNKASIVYLEQLYTALTQSRFNYSSNDYGGEWITWNPSNTALAWKWLQDHKDYGVSLVCGSKGEYEVNLSDQPVYYVYTLSEENGDIVLWKRAECNQVPLKENNSFLVGDPAVLVVTQHTGAWTLHQMESKGVTGNALSERIEIPTSSLGEFQTKYFPKLTQQTTFHNRCENIALPEQLSPQVYMDIQPAGPQQIQVALGFHYGEELCLSLDPMQPRVIEKETAVGKRLILRDEEKESQLKEQMEEALKSLPAFWFGENPKNDLRTLAKLRGLEAARFVVEFLPQLQSDENIVINKGENLPCFKQETDTPQIKFKVSEQNGNGNDWFDLNIEVEIGEESVEFQEIFAALVENKEFLLLENGRYFSLQRDEFRQLKALIEESQSIHDREKGTWKLTPFQADVWRELQKCGIVGEQSRRWETMMQGLSGTKEMVLERIPSKLKAKLRPYQHEGYSWLRFLHEHELGGVLADDMGLGKTVQAIALIVETARARSRKGSPSEPTLVVAPTSVVENWDLELERFAPHIKKLIFRRGDRTHQYKKMKKSDVVVTSYPLLLRDAEVFKDHTWDTLILDEAQWVKNHQSKAYGVIRKLSVKRRFALTGTPMENNLMELWSISSIVAPGLFGSPKDFRAHYQNPIEKMNDGERLGKLQRRLRPFLMRRKKEVVEKDLPPKTEQVLYVELDPAHQRLYERQLQHERKKVLDLLKTGGLQDHRFEILRSLTVMRQMCLHPGLVDPKHANHSVVKLEELLEQIRTLTEGGHRALVFSQFTSFLSHVRRVLEKEKLDYLYLDGATQNRKELVQTFQGGNGPSIFLISLKAGGVGLNLTAADYCILLDPWWNPAVENQAIDRTHRIGQNKHVFVYKMIAKNTVEEKVLKLQQKKRQLFENVLEKGNRFGSAVTEEDIKELFGA